MLWIFGDSFAGNWCRLDDKSRTEEEFPYPPYTWQKLLSQKYNHEYKLRGLGGGSNHDAFRIITKYLHQIRPGDMVVTILTSPLRELEVTEDKYTATGGNLSWGYTDVLYNTPPPEGTPIITSHLANEIKDEGIEACRLLRIDNYNLTPKISKAWLHWTLDYWQSFVNHFNSVGVRCIASGIGALSGDVHYDDWATLHESYSCDCKHFTREGHKWNYNILEWAIEKELNYVDLRYVLDNGPEEIQPRLKT